MKYAILFGDEAKVEFDNSNDFQAVIALSQGIKAVQKSDESKTVTFLVDAPELPEEAKGNWVATAVFLITFGETNP